MTTPADDATVEEAFEAYLAGRVVPGAGDGLAFFADAVRASAMEPGRPSAALADLLATGLLTDLSSSSARTTRSAVPGRRRRTRMFLPALLAKLASAGLVAKAATGAGLVAVGLTTVGFTGHLPDSAQHTFATVVDSVTPLTAPDPQTATDGTTSGGTDSSGTDSSGTDSSGTEPSGTETSGTETPDTDTPGTTPSTPTPFGQQVSQLAHDDSDGKPGVDGQAVSSLAHDRNQQRKGGAAAVSPSPVKAAEPESDDDSSTTGSGPRSGRGHGSDD
jgi:hypothetical protein